MQLLLHVVAFVYASTGTTPGSSDPRAGPPTAHTVAAASRTPYVSHIGC